MGSWCKKLTQHHSEELPKNYFSLLFPSSEDSSAFVRTVYAELHLSFLPEFGDIIMIIGVRIVHFLVHAEALDCAATICYYSVLLFCLDSLVGCFSNIQDG